jgi:hypothetical protein
MHRRLHPRLSEERVAQMRAAALAADVAAEVLKTTRTDNSRRRWTVAR